MKKLSLSLMLNVSLALMLALSLIYPQSVAVSFVATWAILATVICVVAGGVGVYATEYVLERYGRELPPESLAVKIVTSLFLQPVPWRRRAAALVVMVATFISLVAAGCKNSDVTIFTASDLRGGNHVKADDCAGRVVIAGGGGSVSGEA